MLGNSQPDSGDTACGLTIPEGSTSAGSTCQSPATLMTLILQHRLSGQWSDPRLDTPLSLSGPTTCYLRLESTRPMLGSLCFLLHRVDSANLPARGAREEEQLWNRLFTPQVRGVARPQGCLRFCTTPKRPLRVRAVRVCVSECELFKKHAFWHKTCDITHFIRFEALL